MWKYKFIYLSRCISFERFFFFFQILLKRSFVLEHCSRYFEIFFIYRKNDCAHYEELINLTIHLFVTLNN